MCCSSDRDISQSIILMKGKYDRTLFLETIRSYRGNTMKKIIKAVLTAAMMSVFMTMCCINVFADYKYVPIEDCIDIVNKISSNDSTDIYLSDSDINAIERVLDYDKERTTNGVQYVKTIKFDRNRVEVMAVGDVSDAIVAELSPMNGLGGRLTWYSSDPSVVTVDTRGIVTAHGAGHAAVFSESENGIVTYCGVYVTPYKPISERLTLTPSENVCEVGSKFCINVNYSGYITKDNSRILTEIDSPDMVSYVNDKYFYILGSDNFIFKNKKYTYDFKYGTVISNPYYTALKPGTVTFNISLPNGCSKNVSVTIKPKASGITLSDSSVEMYKGEVKKLTATVTPDDAYDKTVTWTSSDTSVATVDQEGNVTAASDGTTTITAKTSNGIASSCIITVLPDPTPTGIAISPDTDSYSMMTGQTYKLTAEVTPSNAFDKTIEWTSDNTSVATVSADGLVTANNIGQTKITATTVNGLQDHIYINVKPLAQSISISASSLELLINDTKTLSATVSPDNAYNKTVIWSSSNPSVVTVSSNGTLKAISAGSATVYASVKNPDATITASCNVTVFKSVTIDAPSEINLAVGQTTNLINDYSPKKIVLVYSVDPKDIVSISGTKIKGLKAGTATIIIKNSRDSTVKTVTVHVTTVKMNQTYYEKEVGDTFTVNVTVPSGVSESTLTWSSSDPSIATVSDKGVVKCLAEGTVKITCTAPGGSSATATILVKEKPVEGKIIFAPGTSGIITIRVGESYTVDYSVEPSTMSATVFSSNTRIATVKGKTIYANESGETTIVFQPENGKSRSLLLKVMPSLEDEQLAQIEYAKEILYYVNIEREKAGVNLLTLDYELCELAQIRANECIEKYSHTRPDGTFWNTILDSYSKNPSCKGENIISGSGYSPEECVEYWMSSSAHKANILNPNFTKLGVGSVLYYTFSDKTYWGIYVTQLFANL